MGLKHWILNKDHTTTIVDLNEWARWFETADRVVAKTDIDGFHVSTVFIGINHNFGPGPPHIFETAVFDDKSVIDMERASTWDDALIQHNAMVRKHMTARQDEVKRKTKKERKEECPKGN